MKTRINLESFNKKEVLNGILLAPSNLIFTGYNYNREQNRAFRSRKFATCTIDYAGTLIQSNYHIPDSSQANDSDLTYNIHSRFDRHSYDFVTVRIGNVLVIFEDLQHELYSQYITMIGSEAAILPVFHWLKKYDHQMIQINREDF